MASAFRATSCGPTTSSRSSSRFSSLSQRRSRKRDALLVAELVERDAQELGRAVDDQGADLTVEDSQIQPVEQDAGAARVVDQQVAVLQVTSQILHGRVEVAVPAVVLDGVVAQAEGVDRLQGPVLVGYAREAGRPLEPPPRPPADGSGR